jgi:hypothetical protein
MKISKISWVFLIVGVVVIAALSLGMNHSAQTDQQRQLEDALTSAKEKLSSISNEDLVAKQAQLSQDVSKYTTQIDSTKGRLAADWDSIDATKGVLEVAAPLNLDVVSVTSSGAGVEELAGTPCNTLGIDIQVEGAINDISDFVLRLSQDFPTAIVKLVQLDSLNTAGDVPTAEVKDTRGNIHMVIYSYGGK